MDRVERVVRHLQEYRWLKTASIHEWHAVRADYLGPEDYHVDEEAETIKQGDWLVNSGRSVFLEATVVVPPDFLSNSLGFVFEAGGRGEGLLSIDGQPYHGLDRNHSFVPLPERVFEVGGFRATIELYNPQALPDDELNHQVATDETAPPALYLKDAKLVASNQAVEKLLWTIQLYHGSARQLIEGSLERTTMDEALIAVADSVLHADSDELKNQAWVSGLQKALERAIEAPSSGPPAGTRGTIRMVGQSHIDLAWLWPLKETVRKTSRTFSTACTLLDQYPNFVYAQSQPQLYQYVKQHHVSLYERIKEQVRGGRWEIVGGMWVEPDLNIPSGESLARQLLLGKRFFREEFDASPRIEWLPDTFGYCASLPQLLKKSGIEYFMTTKMNWNDTNPFPYDLFYWVGIDGTRVLSFLNHGLNEHTTPQDVAEHWNSYRQKNHHPEQMLLYGHGDGGGGVTREMVEYVELSDALPGLPHIVHSTAHEFFDGVRDANPPLPQWIGDLYLELHRGTYTTHGRNKRLNRKAEVLYREAEIWSSFAFALGATYPAHSLNEGWKLLLLNQFHDIIPGSSIHEVYESSYKDYDKVLTLATHALMEGMNTIASRINTDLTMSPANSSSVAPQGIPSGLVQASGQPLVLFNSLSWMRSDELCAVGTEELMATELRDADGHLLPVDVYVNLDGKYELAAWISDLPPMGYKTVFQTNLVSREAPYASHASDGFQGAWSTENYEVEWNEAGGITRLFDKASRREVVPEGSVANELQLFRDEPLSYDAWNVDPRLDKQRDCHAKLQSATVVLKGKVRQVLRFRWCLRDSTIEQDVIFHRCSKRIDFVTKVDWHEAHKMLKVAFPVDVLADHARFEIPFGSVTRSTHTNTSWDRAQFEVCGHRFADLSEGGYGVSLLNDCKYGYDVKGNVLRLSLLRSPKWPDPQADMGKHEFTYSLLPHEGNWRDANVVRAGYELNHPIYSVPTTIHEGDLPAQMAFLTVTTEHGVVETVKQAEEGHDLVLRLYESGGGRESVHLTFVPSIKSIHRTNLLEEVESSLPLTGVEGPSSPEASSCVTTQLKPFEVQTLRVSTKLRQEAVRHE